LECTGFVYDLLETNRAIAPMGISAATCREVAAVFLYLPPSGDCRVGKFDPTVFAEMTAYTGKSLSIS
jgi:hypothetical protein